MARVACASASTLLLFGLCRSGEWRWNYALVAASATEAARWALGSPALAFVFEVAWATLAALAGLETGARIFRYAPRRWARVKRVALLAVAVSVAVALCALRLPEVERWGYRGLLLPLCAACGVLAAVRGGVAAYAAPRERLGDAVLGWWPWALAAQAAQVAAWELSISAGQLAGRVASAVYVAAALATTTATGALDPEPDADEATP